MPGGLPQARCRFPVQCQDAPNGILQTGRSRRLLETEAWASATEFGARILEPLGYSNSVPG